MHNTTRFNPSSIAISTITSYPKWYRGKLRSFRHTDKIRGDLAIELAQKARDIGYQIVIADSKSTRTFRRDLKKILGVILIRRRSEKRSPSKRQALRKALHLPGVKVIILTEPEKVSLVQDCIPLIAKPILNGEADIVVPKRNDELFKKTYPSYQYESEIEANKTYSEELKSHKLIHIDDEDLDMFFGPRAFSNTKQIISLFMKRYGFSIAHASFPKWYFDVEQYSNTSFFPIVAGLKKGIKIKSVEVPFKYPYIQKQNEERGSRELFLEKRKAQQIELIIELLHFVAFLEKYHGTRVKTIYK